MQSLLAAAQTVWIEMGKSSDKLVEDIEKQWWGKSLIPDLIKKLGEWGLAWSNTVHLTILPEIQEVADALNALPTLITVKVSIVDRRRSAQSSQSKSACARSRQQSTASAQVQTEVVIPTPAAVARASESRGEQATSSSASSGDIYINVTNPLAAALVQGTIAGRNRARRAEFMECSQWLTYR